MSCHEPWLFFLSVASLLLFVLLYVGTVCGYGEMMAYAVGQYPDLVVQRFAGVLFLLVFLINFATLVLINDAYALHLVVYLCNIVIFAFFFMETYAYVVTPRLVCYSLLAVSLANIVYLVILVSASDSHVAVAKGEKPPRPHPHPKAA
jgi:hypothetical protein